MKKLILAIIAVCCVQLAYTAYNATEAGRQELAQVISKPVTVPLFGKPPVAELAPSEDEAIDLDPAAEFANVSSEPIRRVLPRRKFRRNRVVTYDHNFETTSIVVPKGEKYEFKEPDVQETKVAAFTQRKVPNSAPSVEGAKKVREKRSILDKTGSVIKKPFKWLKNIFAKND
ncbi:MAG TPA: hypothetical protein PKC65_13880 [Pyrinomonadaceae bacterium]|nr:hypothetical protein [Pyrinomonadaceae bacterium]